MGKNVSTAVVSFRMTHEDIAALKKIAEARDLKVNAMLGAMMARRIKEIRQEEGW